MAGDKRELILDLLARDKTGPATSSASKHVKDVGDAADKASKSTTKFSESTDKAAAGADDLGDEAKGAAGDLQKLERELKQASAELVVLARSFAQADDAAQRLDLSKSIRKAEGDIRRLTKSQGIIGKSLVPDDPGPVIKSFIGKLGAGLSGAGDSIATAAGGSVGPVVGGAIAAAAAPVLVSALGSALSGASAGAALAGGVALAVSKSDAVKVAGADAGKKFMDGLTKEASKSFSDGTLLSALGVLEDAGERITKTLGKAFSEVSGEVVPLTRKIAQSAETILNAFVKMGSSSALDALGDSVLLVSDSVGSFLNSVSDGSPEAAANLRLVAGATADLVTQSGFLIGMVGKLANNSWITGPILPLLRKHYQDTADASDKLAGSTQATAGEMDGAAASARGERTALDELSTALRAQADPVFALLQAQETLTEKQKAAAKATKEHGRKSEEAKKALRDLASAALDLEGKAGALGDTFNGELTPQLRATFRAAGLTEAQINDLAKQFRGAKRDGDRFAKDYRAKLSVAGGSKARSELIRAREIANDIPRAITIAMRVTGVTNVSKARSSINKQYQARAAGGPISKDTPYWVGENGPELIFPSTDGRVLSAAASRGAQARTRPEAGGGGGGGPQKLRLELVGQREVVTMFRYLVRSANLLEDN